MAIKTEDHPGGMGSSTSEPTPPPAVRHRARRAALRTGILTGVLGGVLGLAGSIAGCANGSGDLNLAWADRESLRTDGRLPAVKPAGMVFEREGEEDEHDAGPPPYGYIKIIGEPDPNWRPGAAGGAGARSGMTWTFLGPKPISSEYWSGEGNAGGHVNAIAPHPTDPNTCYIATDSGGVWKTTDGGTNWVPLTDALSIMNHGAVALDPAASATVYIGTGAYFSGSSGDGIFRSQDAGATWARVATTGQVGQQVTALAVKSTDSNVVYATTSSGFYHTSDGGATWTGTLTGTACTSLTVHPTTPGTLYMGRRGQGVYKSLNDGTTFTKLGGGLPASGFSTVMVALAASNPQVVYAAFVNGGSLQGLYRTSDGGLTWTKKTATPNFPNPQGDWNVYVGVDPTNENTVICGGVDPRYATSGIIRSTNGGDTWAEVSAGPSQVHPDHHCIAWGPTGVIWEGNDGGIYKSTNGGTSWTNLNATLSAAQIYNLVVHPTQPNRALGGAQDNGTPEKTSASLTWPQLQVGDGGFSVIDPTSTTRRYTTYVYLDVTRWNGGSGTDITGGWGSDPVNFIAPLVGDPNSNTTLLGGTNRVWRTTNATAGTVSWTAISPTTVASGGTLNAIAVAKGASNTIYTGSTTGKVYVTTDASTWNNRSTGLPSAEISDVVIAPADPGVAYVSFYTTTGNRVLKTTNFGVSWTSMTGTLPTGVRANALAVDWTVTPEALYVGAGAGLYSSLDGGATWTKNNASLPNVNIGDLFIDQAARVIYAGTYGRGAWKADLPVPAPECPADVNGDGVVDFGDYLAFLNLYDALDPAADLTGDGVVDFGDYLEFLNHFDAGC